MTRSKFFGVGLPTEAPKSYLWKIVTDEQEYKNVVGIVPIDAERVSLYFAGGDTSAFVVLPVGKIVEMQKTRRKSRK